MNAGLMSHSLASAGPKRIIFISGFFVAIVLIVGTLWYLHAYSGADRASAAADQADGVDVLLGLADTAFHEHRLVAPAGSNMYEFYLSVLELNPRSKPALDRLNSSFESAAQQVEHSISVGDLDEAERELRLLRDYSTLQGVASSSYKADLLGSYLHAQRNVLTRRHEAEAAQIQEAHTPSG